MPVVSDWTLEQIASVVENPILGTDPDGEPVLRCGCPAHGGHDQNCAIRYGADGKLFVTSKLLELRRAEPELFEKGDYQALQVEGSRAQHVFAFARSYEGRRCIVVVPRWVAKLMDCVCDLPSGPSVWADTAIGIGTVDVTDLREIFSDRQVNVEETEAGRVLRVADVLAEFPVAVLTS